MVTEMLYWTVNGHQQYYSIALGIVGNTKEGERDILSLMLPPFEVDVSTGHLGIIALCPTLGIALICRDI